MKNLILRLYTITFLLMSFSVLSFAQETYSKDLQKANKKQAQLKAKPNIKKRDQLLVSYDKIIGKNPEEKGFAYLYMGELCSHHSPELLQDLQRSLDYYRAANALLTEKTPYEKSKALYNIGLYHYKGRAIPQNLDSALIYFGKAAIVDPKLCVGVGELYEFGSGVTQDLSLALNYYNVAIQNGTEAYGKVYSVAYAIDRIDENKLDTIAFEKYKEAILEHSINDDAKNGYASLLEAAERGYVPAQFEIGTNYLNGAYRPDISGEKCEYWLSKAAEQNYIPAINNLGVYYERFGIGIYNFSFSEKKRTEGLEFIKKGFNLFQKAAEAGHPQAQVAVGIYYQQGNGIVSVDYNEAYKWYSAAASQGYKQGEEKTKQLDAVIAEEQRRQQYAEIQNFLGTLGSVFQTLADATQKNNNTIIRQNNTANTSSMQSNSLSATSWNSSTSASEEKANMRNTGSDLRNKQIEGRVYNDYVGSLMNMYHGIYPFSKGFSQSDRIDYQSKMKQIRQKWINRGYSFYKSESEDWNGVPKK